MDPLFSLLKEMLRVEHSTEKPGLALLHTMRDYRDLLQRSKLTPAEKQELEEDIKHLTKQYNKLKREEMLEKYRNSR